MTTIYDARVPRKRVATYGKAVGKRVPDYGFKKVTHNAEPHKIREERAVLSKPLQAREHQSPAGPNGRSTTLHLTSFAASDIFQVPSSDDEVALTIVKPAVVPADRSADEKRGSSNQNSGLRILPLTSSAVSDIFNMPTSDDEAVAPAKRSGVKRATAPKPRLKHRETEQSKSAAAKQMKVRREAALHHVPLYTASPSFVAKSTPRHPKRSLTSQKFEQTQTRQIVEQTSTLTTRPSAGSREVKPAQQNSPLKAFTEPALPTAPEAAAGSLRGNTAINNDVPNAELLSVEAQLPWDSLLDPATEHHFNGGLNYARARESGKPSSRRASANTTHNPKRKSQEPANISPDRPIVPSRAKRRRLIDTLVEQTVHEEDIEDMVFDWDRSAQIAAASLPLDSVWELDSQKQSNPPGPANPSVSALGIQGSQHLGPKITYSRQRSMLAEEDPMQELDNGLSYHAAQNPQQRRTRRGSMPVLQPLLSFTEEVEDADGGASVTAIRSVHELRQAGANKRFLDELDDILERIATPSGQLSTRRSGLLDLAEKMRDKNFIRQFRANGGEQRVFLHLGQELDLVSGFLMISLLVTLLADASMPHIVTQLRRQGVARLLIRLLECRESIIRVGRERKTNMSGIAKLLLSDQHDFLLQLCVWEELQPQSISPRTLALKCLETMVRQTREAGDPEDIFSKELTTKLFAILTTATGDSVWDSPKESETIDFCLALSALESHSITARTVQDESIWISDYLPVVALILKSALTKPVQEFGMLHLLTLRLTLNVTNNNPRASDVFAKDSLIAVMGQTIVKKFITISRSSTEGDLSLAVDHLILVLGVMINFVEWSPAARESLQNCPAEVADPLNSMIRLFMDNQERTHEADSVEESAKNVAFGYLSVLLGYLCLIPAVSEWVRSRQPRRSLKPLTASIEEFIGHHRAADDLIQAADDGYSAHTGLTERLENLVTKLIQNSECEG